MEKLTTISYNTIYRSIYRGLFNKGFTKESRGSRRKLKRKGKPLRKQLFDDRGKFNNAPTIHGLPFEADVNGQIKCRFMRHLVCFSLCYFIQGRKRI